MTEMIVNKVEYHPIPWGRFLSAFLIAPVIGTLPLLSISYVGFFVLMVGYPVYLAVGLPIAVIYLRRSYPRYLEIITMAVFGQLALVPAGAVITLFSGDWGVMQAVPAFMMCGAIFGSVWVSIFTALYRALIRNL